MLNAAGLAQCYLGQYSALGLKSLTLTQPLETDTATPVVPKRIKLTGLTTETDVANAIRAARGRQLGQPAVAEIAQAVMAVLHSPQRILVGFETDSVAFPITARTLNLHDMELTITLAGEVELAIYPYVEV